MENEQLITILSDENHKITFAQLEQLIYELKNDTLKKSMNENEESIFKMEFYKGESNAFQICLDFMEHLIL